jgi:hypothetical protein
VTNASLSSKRKTLESRFIKFASSLDGFEAIDDLTAIPGGQTHQIADFFAESRTFIIEVKTVESQQHEKYQAFIDALIRERGYPKVYGSVHGGDVLMCYSDHEQLFSRMREMSKTHMESLFRSANRQIKHTKEAFELPNAMGVVIFLNETENFYSPYNVAVVTKALLEKRLQNSNRRFPSIDGFCGLIESHRNSEIITATQPIVTMVPTKAVNPRAPEIQEFLNKLIQLWSQSNNSPLVEPINKAESIRRFRPVSK